MQREGLEYEFTLVLDLAIEGHIASATKDRTNLFDGAYFTPSEETGQQIAAWLGSALQPSQPAPMRGQLEEAPFMLGQVYRCLEQLSKEQLIEQIAILRQCGESNERREQLIDILNQQRQAA